MLASLVFFLSCLSGFILFSRVQLPKSGRKTDRNMNISVIIPARNEENNLPNLLSSLSKQTVAPSEIIVVDDFSSDRTAEVASRFAVRVIQNTQLPDGWTGKTWAVWNGYLQSTGDILVFLDADVTLAPRALEALLAARDETGGAVSVVPFHQTGRFYEKLALLPCLLGIFAFTSPFERGSGQKGLYGSCIIISRPDYEKAGGHSSIKAELLDDLSFGRKLAEAGIPVKNYIGTHLVRFRMYPGGLGSLVQGFGKGAVLSTATLRMPTVLLIAFWLVGLLACEFATPFLLLFSHPLAAGFLTGYIFYTLQIIYFNFWTGRYGVTLSLLHVFSSALFLFILLYSAYQVSCLGYVSWKGRHIRVGKGKSS